MSNLVIGGLVGLLVSLSFIPITGKQEKRWTYEYVLSLFYTVVVTVLIIKLRGS